MEWDCFSQRNGFDYYEFICNHNGNTCSICSGLNGKHFKVEKMMPGENAPPMHPHCRCSTAAWEDSDEYEAWLDYLSKGGTTEEWNDHGKAEWEKKQNQPKKTAAMKRDPAKFRAANAEENSVENSKNGAILNIGEASREPVTPGDPGATAENIRDLTKYKRVSDEEFKDWKKSCSNCTKEEYKQINKHSKPDGTNGGYIRSHRAWQFNAELRNGNESQMDDDDKATLSTIRKLCKQNKTDRPVILDRYVDSDYLTEYSGFFNKHREDLIDEAIKFVKSDMVGKNKPEKGIVSASYANNVLTDRDIHIRLHCPEGTHMFVTNNKRESEVLFHDGLTYEIVDVSKESFKGLFGDKHRMVLDVVVINNGL